MALVRYFIAYGSTLKAVPGSAQLDHGGTCALSPEVQVQFGDIGSRKTTLPARTKSFRNAGGTQLPAIASSKLS